VKLLLSFRAKEKQVLLSPPSGFTSQGDHDGPVRFCETVNRAIVSVVHEYLSRAVAATAAPVIRLVPPSGVTVRHRRDQPIVPLRFRFFSLDTEVERRSRRA
jgi:hypothetical protein